MSNIYERLNNLNLRSQRAIATVVLVANGMITVQPCRWQLSGGYK